MEQPASTTDTVSVSFTTPDSSHGIRLDHFLVRMMAGASRSQIVGSVKQGSILVNGTAVKAGHRLKGGDEITGRLSTARPDDHPPEPQAVDFTCLYEDSSLLVIAKPPHLVVHPGSGNRDRTLINGLLHRFGDLAGVGDDQRPGIVHRLDKDTSGIMVIARTRNVHRHLVQAFKERQVQKTYLALVHGIPECREGLINAPIGRHPVHRQKMAIRQTSGRPAVSRWRMVHPVAGFGLLEVVIETGRTHQIRVHLASIGHPVAGDQLYGANRPNDLFPRQLLHAWKLRFTHPASAQLMSFTAPMPDDFAQALKILEEDRC